MDTIEFKYFFIKNRVSGEIVSNFEHEHGLKYAGYKIVPADDSTPPRLYNNKFDAKREADMLDGGRGIFEVCEAVIVFEAG